MVQKARTLKPVAEKPRKKQYAQKPPTAVRAEKAQPRRSCARTNRRRGNNNDFLTKALIFGTGVAVGGVLKN